MSLPIQTKLPSEFFEQEVRCGYEVIPKLKKIWAVELDLFSEFSRVCQKHNIEFHVCFGTLLGAVRHHGFIPWDDDFDVWMTRENLERLKKVSFEFKHPYFFQTPLSDRRYFVPLCRLRNCNTTGAITQLDTPDYNNGIYMDIYALDGLADSMVKRVIQYYLKVVAVKFISTYYQKGLTSRSFKGFVFYLLRPFAHLLSYESWNRIYDKILSMYTDSSDKLTYLMNGTRTGKWWHVEKSELSKTVYLPYEGVQVPVPGDFDHILKRIYGDYMKFPPVEQRGKWHEGIIHFEPETPYKEFLKGK